MFRPFFDKYRLIVRLGVALIVSGQNVLEPHPAIGVTLSEYRECDHEIHFSSVPRFWRRGPGVCYSAPRPSEHSGSGRVD
jgi:hypothetical protein